MRVNKMLAAAGAVAVAATLTGVALSAEEPRRVRRADFPALQSEIGLTDQQVAEIDKIRGEDRKAAIRRGADLRIARIELDELLAKEKLDEAAIAARVKTIGELQAQSFKARAESQLAIRRLVTAEQYQKMQHVRRRAVEARRDRPARRDRGYGRGPGRGPGGPGMPGPGGPDSPADEDRPESELD